MSKRTPRSKKGDGNVPNFVFKLGGDASGTPPSFNFSAGATTPASPSSTGFPFSNPSSPATSSMLNIGGALNSPTTSTQSLASQSTHNSGGFNFNSTSNTATGSLKRQQSEVNFAPNKRDSSSIRRATSDIGFGTNSSGNQSPTFTFGTTVPSSTTTTTPSSAFNFSKPSTATSSSGFNPSQITFGSTAVVSNDNTTNSPTASAFKFAVPKAPAETSKNSVTSASSFMPPTATSTDKTPATPAFSFSTPTATKSTSGTEKPPTPAFSFGAPSTTPTTSSTGSTAKPEFTFGASSTTPATPKFSFGEKKDTDNITKPSETATNKPGFTFGNPTSSATSSSSTTGGSGFSFKPAETPKASTSTPTTTTTTNPVVSGSKTTDDIKTGTAGFSFSNNSPKTSTSATTTSAAPSFTSTPSTSTSTSTSTVTKEAPKFTFGTTQKDDKPAASNSAITFGTTATPAPPKPNVFSFTKLLEDLEKTATQPPQQIYATLIPSSSQQLSGFPQQTVHYTNFRIDNILPSTRFTELPEQAQKELDEIEKYIREENQRCEYIASHKIRQHHDAAAETKKQIESLTQQLDAVGNMLKGQKQSIESLYDTVKEQLRHANDGSVVLEACKHPGNNARWLFGYTEEDDYFSQLSKQLSSRMEEYKKCIWEIERTAEAWTQNKVQSPQDIANIMRAQNVTFLALSNKVASLHESVNAEKNNYSRYLKMYN